MLTTFGCWLDNLLSNALANRLPDTAVEMQLDADDKSWLLRIRNSGEISKAVREKMFDPFVSGSTSWYWPGTSYGETGLCSQWLAGKCKFRCGPCLLYGNRAAQEQNTGY